MKRVVEGTILGGRYRVVRLLGKGGMGSVYEAFDAEDGARVAVKVIAREVVESETLSGRFEREVRAAAEVVSPHIVRVLGSGHDGELLLPFLVMEYLDGEDLSQLIKRSGPLPPDLALRIAAQACEGMARAHDKRIVHRDIKPANFFLAKEKRGARTVKLLDFGVAKIRRDPGASAAETAGLTRTGNMLGSPLYMSPEQARGHKDIDDRSDIWSLGIVLYQALSGHTPHHDTDMLGELLISICTEPPEPLQDVAPWVSAEVAALVHRALRFDPDERFQSAAEMGAAIAALLPEGSAIREDMLRPLDPGERSAVAPKVAHSLADAPAPRKSAAQNRRLSVSGESAITAPTGVAADASVPALGSSVVTGSPRAAQSSPKAARGVVPALVAALVLAALGLAYKLVSPAPPAQQAAPPAASTAVIAAEKPRTVRLVIIPDGASVEVDGAPAPTKEGLAEIHGTLGSVHRVRVVSAAGEKTSDVVITEDGPLPPKIEIPAARAAASGAASSAAIGAAASAPRGKPSAAPKPTAPAPPPDLRTGR
ncbi:MAG: serine/threonine-protein kinase [Byssovorax sp.]